MVPKTCLAVVLCAAGRCDALAARAEVINASLRQPLLTPEWEAKFETAFKESLAMIGDEASGVQLIRKTMMLLYRDAAVEAAKAKQYIRARSMITKGRSYVADAKELDEVDTMLVQAQRAVLRKQEHERRDARVAEVGNAVLAHAAAGRVEDAARALKALRDELPDETRWVSEAERAEQLAARAAAYARRLPEA